MSPRLARSQYQPSGRFSPPRLLLVLSLLPLAAGVMGGIYYGMVALSWYLLALSIAFTVGTACSFSAWAIRYAHCRNRPLAVALGVVIGLGGYLCHFHIDHVVRWGAPVTAVHELPGYVAFRMATDTWVEGVILEPLQPAPGLRPVAQWGAGPLSLLNWGIFLVDFLTLAIAPAATALYVARWPYSERQRRWCSRESLLLEKESGATLEQALNDRVLTACSTSELRRVDSRQPHVRVTVWYTPSENADDADTEVFVSVAGRRPVRLELGEAASLVLLFPGLQALAGVSPVGLQPELSSFDPLLAHIWPVPSCYAGTLATNWRRQWRRGCRNLKLFGIPLAGMIFLFGGNIVLLTCFVIPGKAPTWVLPAYIAGLGFPLWFYVHWFVGPINMWEVCFRESYAMLADALRKRPDALVKPGDPEAIYVELLPRRLWEPESTTRIEESNEGLLRFDWDRGVALFEGENQRILLPAASILKAHIEAYPGIPEHREGLYGIILQVRTQAGVWDLPFFPLLGLPVDNSRDRAEMLLSLFLNSWNLDLRDQLQEEASPDRVPIAL